MPLADGRAWTFAISAVDSSIPQGVCPVTTATVDGMAPAPNGGSGWNYQPACAETIDHYTMVQNGDDILAYKNGMGQPIEYMKTPIAEGATFSYYVWRKAPATTVPAGTFDDCWRRELLDGGPNEFVIFCRGVGPVQTESASTNVRTLLTSKNF